MKDSVCDKFGRCVSIFWRVLVESGIMSYRLANSTTDFIVGNKIYIFSREKIYEFTITSYPVENNGNLHIGLNNIDGTKLYIMAIDKTNYILIITDGVIIRNGGDKGAYNIFVKQEEAIKPAAAVASSSKSIFHTPPPPYYGGGRRSKRRTHKKRRHTKRKTHHKKRN